MTGEDHDHSKWEEQKTNFVIREPARSKIIEYEKIKILMVTPQPQVKKKCRRPVGSNKQKKNHRDNKKNSQNIDILYDFKALFFLDMFISILINRNPLTAKSNLNKIAFFQGNCITGAGALYDSCLTGAGALYDSCWTGAGALYDSCWTGAGALVIRKKFLSKNRQFQ
ncbi:hypothetical protein BpHYR1_015751 [Brachionus plicatilis]|uniref:Uncharacterized protein n=1 Tax=Brachionus plicatilis TaxID=10195 RepID=A0A3M7PDG9_BRAPC|nr:hypothetical protein BpHYR1_015751 [Brachionus plicatilis]